MVSLMYGCHRNSCRQNERNTMKNTPTVSMRHFFIDIGRAHVSRSVSVSISPTVPTWPYQTLTKIFLPVLCSHWWEMKNLKIFRSFPRVPKLRTLEIWDYDVFRGSGNQIASWKHLEDLRRSFGDHWLSSDGMIQILKLMQFVVSQQEEVNK